MDKKTLLTVSLYFIGIVQLFFGLFFLLAPSMTPIIFGLESPPEWVSWMFVFMSARFLGFAIGMFVAAQDPLKYKLWIIIMIGIQAVDWIGTILYVLVGTVNLVQASTASFLPLIFILLLGYSYPKENP